MLRERHNSRVTHLSYFVAWFVEMSAGRSLIVQWCGFLKRTRNICFEIGSQF